MGKRRKTLGDRKLDSSNRKGTVVKDWTSSLLDPSSRGFVYDEVDDYEDEQDQLGLSLARSLTGKPRMPQEQVLGIDGSSSDGDDDEEDDEDEESDQDNLFMEDDIVEEQKQQLPDERAWGTNKRRYIGTDTTDEKIHRQAHGQDEELAQLEEETARKLQERMAAELEHLAADDLLPQEEKGKGQGEVVAIDSVMVDLSGLSRTKKLQLLRRESPEFLPLLEDLREKLKELKGFLAPLVEGIHRGLVTSAALCQYLITKYRLVLNYVCVLSVYMMMKSNIGVVGQHPVVGRLAQYRQLLQELGPCDDKLRSKLEELLPKIKTAKTLTNKKNRKHHHLQLLANRGSKTEVKKRKLTEMLAEPDRNNKPKKKEPPPIQAAEASSDEEQQKDDALQGGDEGEDCMDPEGRRAITYQIAKNKGLTPYRKKEQRNPRVKYRSKYQTKLKKRKGQVRVVRKEVKRYEGEVSGIKSHTIKSIKIK